MNVFILTLDQSFLIDVAWQLLNTVILCGVLSFLLYKPVLKFMEKRRERIQNQLDTADEKLTDAGRLKAEYEKKLREINTEREEILSMARTRAAQREQEIISQAKKEAETLKNRAMTDIQREQEKAKDEMKKQIIEISSAMASRFIKASIDESEQKKLADEVISELGDVKWQN